MFTYTHVLSDTTQQCSLHGAESLRSW